MKHRHDQNRLSCVNNHCELRLETLQPLYGEKCPRCASPTRCDMVRDR